MAVYTASGNVVRLDGVHAYADRKIRKELISGLFNRTPLLTYLTGKMTSDSNLGRPGTLGLIGGSGNFDRVQMAEENGTEVHVRLLADRVGGVKILGQRDTSASTGNKSQDQNVKSAVFRWAGVYQAPIKIWNSTLRLAQGDAKIANAINEGTDQAMEELIDKLAIDVWRAAPSDQSADIWSSVHGLIHVLNDDNTYGNVNRATSTFTNPLTGATENYWAGKRVTTSISATLELPDNAMYQQGMFAKNSRGFDLALCGAAVFHTIKKEALAKGAASMINEEIPEFSKLGVKFDAIKYGSVTYVADPLLTGNWSSFDPDITDASKCVALLTTEDFVFAVNSSENFRTTEFTDQSKIPGGDDAITANINAMPRFYNRRPWRSILYTNVQA